MNRTLGGRLFEGLAGLLEKANGVFHGVFFGSYLANGQTLNFLGLLYIFSRENKVQTFFSGSIC